MLSFTDDIAMDRRAQAWPAQVAACQLLLSPAVEKGKAFKDPVRAILVWNRWRHPPA